MHPTCTAERNKLLSDLYVVRVPFEIEANSDSQTVIASQSGIDIILRTRLNYPIERVHITQGDDDLGDHDVIVARQHEFAVISHDQEWISRTDSLMVDDPLDNDAGAPVVLDVPQPYQPGEEVPLASWVLCRTDVGNVVRPAAARPWAAPHILAADGTAMYFDRPLSSSVSMRTTPLEPRTRPWDSIFYARGLVMVLRPKPHWPVISDLLDRMKAG
ncbi:MAG: hypothetical protein S0880_11775 [Actinomycetota bacterium]|nr:hypothetical protein [Actinomycetota bacterium]